MNIIKKNTPGNDKTHTVLITFPVPKRKQGEPTAGNCVRMNYKFYEPNNTWEAEDCTKDLADYIVCEKHFDITNYGNFLELLFYTF